jgi:SGNH domain (fused to AT3 domains)
MEQYAPRIDHAIKSSPTQMNGAIMLGNQEQCDLLVDIISAADQCPPAMRQQLTAWLSQDSVRAVAIAAYWLNYKELLEKPENQEHFAQFLLSIQQSKTAYLILNVPQGQELAPASMFTGSRLNKITSKPIAEIHFDFKRFEETYTEVNKILSAIADRCEAVLIDPVSYLCPERQCPVIDETGKPLYRDAGHLTRSYVITAATYMDETLIPTRPRHGIVRTNGLSPL